MRILLIDNGTRYLSGLKQLLKPAKTLNWSKFKSIPEKFDLVVLSGGHGLPIMHHDRDYVEEIKLISKTKRPLLGICLGSELIAHTFGAKLTHLKRKSHGIRVIKDRYSKEQFRVYESHHWAISKLPRGLVKIATSTDGIEVFRHKDRPIYGIQFHPEKLVHKSDGRKLFTTILSAIKKDLSKT
jgi:GMP synthase-like glutamine amidotransferase